MTQILVTYEQVKRHLKDTLLREISRYHLPYVNGTKPAAEYYNDWATTVRPLLFDLMSTPVESLGFNGNGSACHTLLGEPNCIFFIDVDPAIHNFVNLTDLTIPYSGPYEPVLTLSPSAEDFNASPWIEDDEVGTIIPAWTDASGVYHEEYYTGWLDISSDGTSVNVHHFNCYQGPSYIYKDAGAGAFNRWYHEFEVNDSSSSLSDRTEMIWGITDSLDTTSEILNTPSLSCIGLFAKWDGDYGRNVLVAKKDLYYNGLMQTVGHGLRHNTGRRDGNDRLENWYDVIGEETKDYKVTVERRGDDAIFLIWRRRQYVVTDGFTDEGVISFPWMQHGYLNAEKQVPEVLHTWPGMDWDYNKAILVTAGTGQLCDVIGFQVEDDTRAGTDFWWPIDIIQIRLIRTASYEYCFFGNAWSEPTDTKLCYNLDGYTISNLKIYGTEDTGNNNLFINGGALDNSYIGLYTENSIDYNDNVPLFLETLFREQSANMYISSKDVYQSTPIYVKGIVHYDSGNVPMFIYDDTGLENLTEYTITDPSSYQDWTYTHTHATVTQDDESTFMFDYGSGYFDNAFNINFEFTQHDNDGAGAINILSLTATDDVAKTVNNNNLPGLNIDLTHDEIMLFTTSDGNESAVYTTPESNMGVLYYCTLEKYNSTTGFEARLRGWRTNDRSGTAEIDRTKSVPDENYRYLRIADSYNFPNANTSDITVANVAVSSALNNWGFNEFVINGYGEDNQSATFYMVGWSDSSNTYTTLQVFGGTDGWYWTQDEMMLYINDGGEVTQSGTLFMYNDEPFVDDTSSATLYMVGANLTTNASMTLVTTMTTSEDDTTFYIKAPGAKIGWSTDVDTMDIFVNRPDESKAATMYIHNEWFSDNTYASIYVLGILGYENDNVSLALPSVLLGKPNTYASIYIQASVTSTGSVDMVMPETLAELTDSVDMVMYSDGGIPNTYCSTYIFGAYLDNDNITLTLPGTVGELNNNFGHYIRGY